ncbi:MAG: single-stranded DNA-binding protein [Armatimonadetes bacterium]|nr:single-stranded DNA-binding protein [Armatimonadota bacterium]
MLNRVILIGRVANDPELKYTPSGIPVSTFRVAVNRPVANAAGEREADFIDVVTWRQAAEFAANYLGKGRLVAVEGRLQIRTWTAPDGTRRRAAEVVVDNLKALDRPRETPPSAPAPTPTTGGYETPAASSVAAGETSEEEFSDPFADE